MKLFRRLLLSLFPSDVIHQQMSYGNMFVTFIAPKQFFSVVNRKMAENYKLNLFDISLDSFEAKIGFGERPTVNVKDLDFYFAYDSTANLNGRTFYTPGNLATILSIVMAVSTKKIFKKEKYKYFRIFAVAVFLLVFVFVAKIKVFPYTEKKKNYKWFIELFFNFYQQTLLQFGEEMSKKKWESLQKSLLQEIHLFFMLFYFYQRVSKLLVSDQLPKKEFYQRILHTTSKKPNIKNAVKDFIDNAHRYTRSSTCGLPDIKIMELIFPADIVIRNLFLEKEGFAVVDKLLSQLFDKDTLHTYLHSFLKGDEKFEEFLHYIMDWKLFKKNYFKGMKKLSLYAFRLKKKYDYKTEKEIDSFISSLEDAESIDSVPIPPELVAESAMVDDLVNFYVTYLGGLRVARGDNFFLRLFKRPLIDALVHISYDANMKQDTVYFYGSLLYTYSKNIFYYQYAYDNMKAGKNVFQLPLKPVLKEVQSNIFILKLFCENFMSTLLQDINKKNIKIYIKNKKILKLFVGAFGKKISKLLSVKKKSSLFHGLYDDFHFFLQGSHDFFKVLDAHISTKELKTVKENIYSMDIQLWLSACSWLVKHEVILSKTYEDMAILGLFASLRETLFGFLLRYTFLKKEAKEANTSLKEHTLIKIYIADVLNIAPSYYEDFVDLIKHLLYKYKDLLEQRIHLDDNQKYFSIGLGNRLSFIEAKQEDQILAEIMGEDIIRFRGYLKTISYYNKRYMIPK